MRPQGTSVFSGGTYGGFQPALNGRHPRYNGRGNQFTCFTGTKVQILTQKTLLAQSLRCRPTQFICFPGTKVEILTQNALIAQPLRCRPRRPHAPRGLAGAHFFF